LGRQGRPDGWSSSDQSALREAARDIALSGTRAQISAPRALGPLPSVLADAAPAASATGPPLPSVLADGRAAALAAARSSPVMRANGRAAAVAALPAAAAVNAEGGAAAALLATVLPPPVWAVRAAGPRAAQTWRGLLIFGSLASLNPVSTLPLVIGDGVRVRAFRSRASRNEGALGRHRTVF
jgi:hypothetical protein